MPTSQDFKEKKKIGRWFEAQCERLMRAKGMAVVDSEKLSYRKKKGWDREVSIGGARCKVECKFDGLSEQTGNVCVEDLSLDQSISPIWLYGIPEGGQVSVYAMYLSDLAPYAKSYPVKKHVGEFGLKASLIPREVFISQPFIKKFGTIPLTKKHELTHL